MLKVEKKPEVANAAADFSEQTFGDQTKPPVLYKGHFYAEVGTNERRTAWLGA